MAIPIIALHTDIRSILRKNSGFFASPDDITSSINRASLDILNRVISQYPQNRLKVDHQMFKIAEITLTSGIATIPSDVYKIQSLIGDDYEGDVLDAYRFNARLKSVILPPSATRPICYTYNDGTNSKIRVAPTSGITKYEIGYWKYPVVATYTFTQTGGVITHTGGTNLDWDMSYYNDILNRALFYLGVTVRDADSAQLERNAQ